MRHSLRAALLTGVLAAAGLLSTLPSVHAALAHRASSCRVLTAPASLGGTLLRLHEAYMRTQPDVHNARITGPVGHIYLGECTNEYYALADFNQTYNGVNFGTTDQPERFLEPPGQGWVDIGNTGGDPCGQSIPTALLLAWKVVRGCPA